MKTNRFLWFCWLVSLEVCCRSFGHAAPAPTTTLIATGSTWKYLDTGVAPSSAWRQSAFDDSSWSNGVAQLGFGDGDEATLVRRTNSAGPTNITIYFRRQFTVADPAAFTNLICRLLRDDGGVVYLNEVEVFLSNMPAGTVSYGTFASTSVLGPNEQSFYVTNVNAGLLLPGENIIAVEIHQVSLASSDVSFELELVGEGLGTPGNRVPLARTETDPITIPSSGRADPYPSVIQIQDIPGLVSNVVIKLYSVTHARPDDIDVLLVGPQGQKVLLMSDAGGTNSITNVNLSFSPLAPVALPDSLPIASGVFQPTAYPPVETLAEPAPAGPYTGTLSDFDGKSPNGWWSLYVRDDSSGATGSIAGGWSLAFTVPQSPPVITVHPRSQTVALGSTVQVTALSSGTPPLRYQWQRGSIDIPGANGITYTIPSITAALAGNYRLLVTNSFGQATSAVAVLTVVLPPTINVHPSTQSSFLGATNVSFSVSAGGTAPLRYQWRQNGWNLPGETNATLRIPSVGRANGGNYVVVVANAAAVVASQGAALILTNLPAFTALDNFSDAQPSLPFERQLLIRGTNRLAGKQPEEPNHGGKVGGSSVWFTWYSPMGGIATVQTLGSTFDTLLGVYTGNNVSSLTNKAGDEDGGLFYTSALRFNVEPLTRYRIAIDGFNGEQGHFVFSLDMEQTALRLPEITSPPTNQTVNFGGTAIFGVAATEPGLTYQWYFADALIRHATNSEWRVDSVGVNDVGTYSVSIHRGVLAAVTNSARLEIGPVAGLVSEDKFPDLLGSKPLPVNPPVIQTPRGPVDAAQCNMFGFGSNGIVCFFALTEGIPIHLVFGNGGSHPGTDSNVCFAINQATHESPPFQVVDSAATRQITVDTVGSTVPTALQVYSMAVVPETGKLRASEGVPCSLVYPGPFGSSIVTFTAATGTLYCAYIDAPPGCIYLKLHYGCETEGVLSISRDNDTQVRCAQEGGVMRFVVPTQEALISWCAVPGTYWLQQTPQLLSPPSAISWTYGPTNLILAGEVHYVVTPVIPAARFFRLTSAPP